MWELSDQLRAAVKFLLNNGDDFIYGCTEKCPDLNSIKVEISLNKESHRIIFSYKNEKKEEIKFEVKE